MKLERIFLIIAIAAIVLAVPLAFALQHRTHQLKIEKSQTKTLQIKLNSKQKALELKNTQLQQEEQQKAEQQKQIDDLKSQLQSKAAAKAKIAQAQSAAAAVARAVPGNCEAYRGLVAQYNWNVDTALAVMNAESTCNATADNPHDGHPTCLGSRGLFGIGCDSTGNYAGMFDPAANIAQAYALYSHRGWQPWSFTTCAVKVACV